MFCDHRLLLLQPWIEVVHCCQTMKYTNSNGTQYRTNISEVCEKYNKYILVCSWSLLILDLLQPKSHRTFRRKLSVLGFVMVMQQSPSSMMQPLLGYETVRSRVAFTYMPNLSLMSKSSTLRKKCSSVGSLQ